ncbi:hypothetical protein KJ813_01230 [bacterium]|nr:hypothetical protein [bacterium]MBU4602941.1 hypothetical protein [bacterium]MCG2707342.1 hypothetical protein [Candidatus Omnitrophota bacterium]
MKLSSETEKKLDAWAKVDTWHTNHKLDMDRWYDFVNQYQKDHCYSVDEAALREIIEKKVEGNVNDLLKEEIRTRISLACNILDFLNRIGR